MKKKQWEFHILSKQEESEGKEPIQQQQFK